MITEEQAIEILPVERVEHWTDEDEAAVRAAWDDELARCTPEQIAAFLGEHDHD